MNRLTNKCEDGSDYCAVENYGSSSQITLYDYPYDDIEDCVNKLGKLEDIEEELGIDLIRSVNICKKANSQKYVYTRESWGVCKLTLSDDLDVELFHHRLYSNSRGVWTSLDLKDYGKNWALTREELEDDK